MKKRCIIANLKKYDLTITTSWETNHGISGHLFEMIEYFYHLKFQKNFNAAMMICDETTPNELKTALQKYEFEQSEIEIILSNTYFYYKPFSVIANDILFVDGSLRILNADLICKRKIFLRCSDDEYLDKADLVLQDYDVYEKLSNSINYKKKILFSKFKKLLNNDNKNTALIYCTTNMRKLEYTDLINIKEKYNFNNYVVLSNKEMPLPQNMKFIKVPAENFYELFDTFIYTGSTNKSKVDCSSRLIVECSFYNKDVIYEHKQNDKALNVRISDIKNKINLELKEDDEISKLITTV